MMLGRHPVTQEQICTRPFFVCETGRRSTVADALLEGPSQTEPSRAESNVAVASPGWERQAMQVCQALGLDWQRIVEEASNVREGSPDSRESRAPAAVGG
eukprot:2503334-Karenia_brevis.AAC.1